MVYSLTLVKIPSRIALQLTLVAVITLLLLPLLKGTVIHFNPANGHYYKIVDGIVSWDTASAAASAEGGYLATITNSDENAFIARRIGGPHKPKWIGGYEVTENDWRWVTDEPFSYKNWDRGEPNNYWGNENRLWISNGASSGVNGVWHGVWNDAVNDSYQITGYVIETVIPFVNFKTARTGEFLEKRTIEAQQKENLVLVVHGLTPGGPLTPDQPIPGIHQALQSLTSGDILNWDIRMLNWDEKGGSRTWDLGEAMSVGDQLAQDIAAQIELSNYQKVHLIGHSMGGYVISKISPLLAPRKPECKIYETYLDPYTPVREKHSLNGIYAIFSENYYTTATPLTRSAYDYAHNFLLDDLAYSEIDPGKRHMFPAYWYEGSIRNPGALLYSAVGHNLAPYGATPGNHTNYPRGITTPLAGSWSATKTLGSAPAKANLLKTKEVPVAYQYSLSLPPTLTTDSFISTDIGTIAMSTAPYVGFIRFEIEEEGKFVLGLWTDAKPFFLGQYDSNSEKKRSDFILFGTNDLSGTKEISVSLESLDGIAHTVKIKALVLLPITASQYQCWLAMYGITPDEYDYTRDTDGDGSLDFLEYAFASDPVTPSNFPTFSPTYQDQRFSYKFKWPGLSADKRYIIESSEDMVTWEIAGEIEPGDQPNASAPWTVNKETIENEWHLVYTREGIASKLFMRVRVEKN